MAMLNIEHILSYIWLYSFITKLKDFFHFLQVKEIPTESKLLFVHQSAYQKSLMKKYDNHIVLLNALIKLLSIQFRSSLSLLKHVKYMVLGSFAIQEETIEAIAEAMDIVMESSLFHGRQLYRRNPLPWTPSQVIIYLYMCHTFKLLS